MTLRAIIHNATRPRGMVTITRAELYRLREAAQTGIDAETRANAAGVRMECEAVLAELRERSLNFSMLAREAFTGSVRSTVYEAQKNACTSAAGSVSDQNVSRIRWQGCCWAVCKRVIGMEVCDGDRENAWWVSAAQGRGHSRHIE